LDHTQIVGILNVTPDSFSDGGKFFTVQNALDQARIMINEGADWIDIGGESSGPGSVDVSQKEELARILPVIKALRQESEVWISVDTWRAEVARQALDAGADAINDVTALRADPELALVIAEYKVPLIMMYSKDATTRTTSKNISYSNILETLHSFFQERIAWATQQGIAAESIIIDPGMGAFISTDPSYSFEIIQKLEKIVAWGYPVLLGPSRKSFLAHVTKPALELHDRAIPCLTVSCVAAQKGVKFLRLHDVKQGRLMLDTLSAIA